MWGKPVIQKFPCAQTPYNMVVWVAKGQVLERGGDGHGREDGRESRGGGKSCIVAGVDLSMGGEEWFGGGGDRMWG